jgi:hypothetical protein
MTKERKVHVLLLLAALGALSILFAFPRLSQDPSYHDFADTQGFWGIPNVMNVLSNIFLVFVGSWGLNCCRINRGEPLNGLKAAFAAAAILTGFGSMIYHWLPGNNSLVWDRLPMALMFMILCLIIIADRISLTAARRLFLPFVLAGIFSVLYWWITELRGFGDLRFYALVQFLPIALLPVAILLFPAGTIQNRNLWYGLGWYIMAKIFEFLDRPIFEMTGFLSGHSLKHVCAAIAVYYLLKKSRFASLTSARL